MSGEKLSEVKPAFRHRPRPYIVVAGLGNEYRRDDGAGPVTAARIVAELGAEDIGPVVDPLDLLGRWDDADLAIVIDAVRSGSAPGSVRVVELPSGDGGHATTSTHGISLGGVWRLAQAVGRAPARVIVMGIEGIDFGNGPGLSAAVEAAVPVAVRRAVALVKEVHPCA
jgi:hydrogenase maturation protease